MPNVLNILIVDDDPNDRALARREIARELPNCQFRQATNSGEFSQALEAGSLDLVVTDYRLRWTDGMAVLASVKSRWRGRSIRAKVNADSRWSRSSAVIRSSSA